MRCPKCFGRRYWIERTNYGIADCDIAVPCDYCDGAGEVSCCEGSPRQLPDKGER